MDDSESLVVLVPVITESEANALTDALKENGIESVAAQHYGWSYTANKFCIRVMKKDQEKAIKIAEELGNYVFNEDVEEESFLKILASPTERIPFLAKYSLNIRLLIMILGLGLLLSLVMLSFFFGNL